MKKHLLKIILPFLVVTLIAPKTFSQNTNTVKKHNIFGIGKDSVIIAEEETSENLITKATYSENYRSYLNDKLLDIMNKLGKKHKGAFYVRVKFVVCKNGTICNLELVEESELDEFNKEALLVINKYKKWKPAIDKNNNKVDSYITTKLMIQLMGN